MGPETDRQWWEACAYCNGVRNDSVRQKITGNKSFYCTNWKQVDNWDDGFPQRPKGWRHRCGVKTIQCLCTIETDPYLIHAVSALLECSECKNKTSTNQQKLTHLRNQKTWSRLFFILKKIYGHSNPIQENTQDCRLCCENMKWMQKVKSLQYDPSMNTYFYNQFKAGQKCMCIHLRHLKVIDLPKLCGPRAKLYNLDFH